MTAPRLEETRRARRLGEGRSCQWWDAGYNGRMKLCQGSLCVCFCIVAVLVGLTAGVGGAAEVPQVLPPNETAYSSDELRLLASALDALREALSDPTYASRKTFELVGRGAWASAQFAMYTAGVLAGDGYEVRLASAEGWPDGVHTWVLVGLPIGDRTAWVPVEASPVIGEKQLALGAIPEEEGASGLRQFDEPYLTFSRSEELPANSPPTAEVRCPRAVSVADWFSLGATGSADEDGSIVLYVWSFGDGTPSSAVAARSVRHRYVRVGTYTVTLTVVDNRGARSTAEASVHSTSSCGCG